MDVGRSIAGPAGFWQAARAHGFRDWSGVPCSLLEQILQQLSHERDMRYVAAVREDSALGVASGAWLAGRPSGILIQNSGIGNLVNPLTSFNLLYKIPVLLVVSWRGEGGKDAPEHILMGARMNDFFALLGIPASVLERNAFDKAFAWAKNKMAESSQPVALVVRKGLFS